MPLRIERWWILNTTYYITLIIEIWFLHKISKLNIVRHNESYTMVACIIFSQAFVTALNLPTKPHHGHILCWINTDEKLTQVDEDLLLKSAPLNFDKIG